MIFLLRSQKTYKSNIYSLSKKIANPTIPNPNDSFLKTKRQAKNLQKIWLEFLPKKRQFFQFLTQNFTEGLQILQSVKKWSKSQEFLVYANSLEDWDQILGDSWVYLPEKQYLDPSSWLKLGKYSNCELLMQEIMLSFEQNLKRIEDFRAGFWPFLDLYWRVKNTDYYGVLSNETLSHPHEIFILCMDFLNYGVEICEEQLKEGVDIGLFHIDCEGISIEIKKFFNEINGSIHNIILEVFRIKMMKLRRFLLSSLKKISGIILKIEDFIEQKEHIDRILQNLPCFRIHKENLELIYQVLIDQKLILTKEDKDIYIDIPRFETQLSNRIQELEASSSKTIERFQVKLSETYIRFRSEAIELETDLSDPLFLEFTEEIEEILRKLRGLKLKVDTLNGSVDKYQDFATRLQIKGFEELKELEIVKREIEVKLLLWESLGDWTGLIENWTKTSFVNLDTEIIGEQSEKYLKIALHCEKNLAQNEVIKRFKGDLEKFRELLPVITALKSTFLKTGHWNELYSLIFLEKGYSPSGRRRISKRRSLWEESEEKIVKSQNKEGFKEDDLQGVILGGEFTLNNLIHLNLLLYKEEIMEISMKAQQEHSLERNLELLERNFEEKALNFKPWDLNSDILILFETDELFQALNETISSINSILSTRYSGFLKKKAELLQKNVLLFEDLMEKWLETQGKWLYFSRIFAMSEVRRDLTLHVSSFDINDKTLKHLMRRLTLNPTVSKLLKISGLNEQFLKLLESFTKLERELEVYLDGKRTLFARLYFLSNEELLDLLSKTKNLVKIQPFLLKLFDNIHTITIVEDLSIKLVISQEGEVLELKKLVFLKGPLENWLEGLQNSMQETLKKMFRKALQEFNSNNLSKLDFINQEIGQISVLTLSLNWTLMVEGVLIEHNPNGLEEIYDISIVHLEKLIKHLKNNENPLFRSKLRNQLILDLHTRDLLQKLLLENVNDINDFNWQQTLRVYQDLDSNEVILIKQLSFCFPYCFEYQGVRPRLVITPLTSRCFLTVSTAFTEGLGVSLWGPAGTGKTETMKELAKFCGVFCLVFNCSEQVSQKTLSQLLIGLVAQGVWGCLDEFNRLGLEVLALVSQQLLIIRMGLAQQQSEIDFDGKMISFKRKTYGFSITMNPGYQGRRELPENLKGLLRPIFMMVPNFEIITEVLLVGMGFHKAKELAISIVRLYKLCEEQLSRQIHYDFGLRALKSMLVWLEGNKNNWEGGIEEIIVIESVKTNNIGKLIKEDLILFNQLISDVFPEFVCKNIENNDNNRNNDIKNNELSNIDNINLIQASKSNPNQSILITPQISLLIKASFEELSFQFTQQLLSKILYLHQTIPLRFGVILLGSPKTAKSTCLKILSHYMNIHPLSLNPKSMALNELFGSMTSNGEWKEGLASFLLKEANVRPEPSWLLFDGPVDSSWIENLNSVLDDNRTLCLANSERIRLKDSMRLFFECEDLHSASPATISRCGVAFFPECQDLWQLILETWVTGLQDYKSEESQERSISQDIGLMVKELGKKVLKEGFVALESYGEKNVAIRSIKSVCNVFEVILNREEVELDEAKDELKRKLNYIWAYAFIWGACAMYDLPNNKVILIYLIFSI